jgi:hypothetical protein
MKKLYAAECYGTFCFVMDTDVVKEDRALDEANKYLPRIKEANIYVDNVFEVESESEIPSEWSWKVPLGAEEVYGEPPHPDCASFFENIDEANRIANKLKELDYDLEPCFVEDLQKILSEP